MALLFMAKTCVPIASIMAAENFILRDKLPQIYEASTALPGVSRAFAGVLAVNVVTSGFFVLTLGGSVGMSRGKFKEKAAKDGDENAEERFSYPKMYAEGFSEAAKLFNCAQRTHQHALETYVQFVSFSLVAGLKFPVTATLGGLLWLYARHLWAEGYKTGEPGKRYQNFFAFGIWTSLIMEMFGAMATTGMIMFS
mmetsp:Transcript_30811/g.52121  ORF Transcript_30811/g.52121 Transcript_30811/m.52121 type:complete len:196 (+) Transcript_30811:82-669(+)|eukprot:CAMPEP_0174989710 /NCGR_PEP_ID=MMETSP0004_2-20121128/20889_1 /TAXON_ID=420556 /ORGANISM="Ochromonas sp., Strain CCMP1393" /LENGTH=195 /DNA_ID=CAMNT_0016243181 /DNA_START=59 /DNA_END=646 /DNA_ORIENTATION=+